MEQNYCKNLVSYHICHEWYSNNLESTTGTKCGGAKLQVREGCLNITCRGAAVAGAVKCTCQ